MSNNKVFTKMVTLFSKSPEKLNNKINYTIIELNSNNIRVTPDNKLSLNDLICMYYKTKQAKSKLKSLTNLELSNESYKFSDKSTKQLVCDINEFSKIIDNNPEYDNEYNINLINEIKSKLKIDESSLIPKEELEVKLEERVLEIDSSIPELDGQMIRITEDNLISVYDTIKAFCINGQPSQKFTYILGKYPDLKEYKLYKFKGEFERNTPVMDLRNIIKLIMVLPGKTASVNRQKFATIIVRYLGGDPTMIEEIENHNNMKLSTKLITSNEYDIRKMDIQLQMEKEKTKQMEINISIELQKEKNRNLELQIELIKLQK